MMGNSKTLQLTHMTVRTIIYALILLVFVGGAAELLARNQTIQELLPFPSVGSSHRVFEGRITLLDKFVEQQGHVDCIFLGSSMVGVGINPDVFSQVYSSLVGEDIDCFNFGLQGLTASTAAIMANYLVEEYQPYLIIYGISARDFSKKAGAPAAIALDIPWMRYQSGDFSLEGWLVEHSYAFRYMLVYRNWMTADIDEFKSNVYVFFKGSTLNGYSNVKRIFENILSPPDPVLEKSFFMTMSDYEVSQKDNHGLVNLLALQDSDTQIVLAELPVHSTYMLFFENGEKDYQIFIDHVEELTSKQDAIFWQVMHLNIIPDDGWMNRNHLNSTGASIYSQWLGEKIANAVQSGELRPIE
jgi:hypothetical protein